MEKINTRERFGFNVNLHRVARGMTQAELARRAGIKQQTLSMIETGKNGATLGTIYAIAKALEIEPGKLL